MMKRSSSQNVNKMTSLPSLRYNPTTIKRSSTQNVKMISSSRSIQNESFSKTQRYRASTLTRGSKLGSKLANELRSELGISSLLLVHELRHELGVSSSIQLGQRSASQLKEIRRISINKQKGRGKLKGSPLEQSLMDSPLLAYASANLESAQYVSPKE